MWCTEIAANSPRGFLDNGWYVGHDEPDIGFFSGRHASSNDMTYKTVLPVDPTPPPSVAFGGSTGSRLNTTSVYAHARPGREFRSIPQGEMTRRRGTCRQRRGSEPFGSTG